MIRFAERERNMGRMQERGNEEQRHTGRNK
jgi:hypothetical protein